VSRDERRAKNEALFRSLNERLKELDDRLDTSVIGAPVGDREEFFCECGRLDCMARVELTRADYDAVREHAERFLVRPGHEDPEIDRVIETHDRFVVIEKLPGVPAEVAQETDPRV
jgi:hypothetical protein